MSVAFEYGGIDREPVKWTGQRQPERVGYNDSDEDVSGPGEAADSQELRDIELMLITQ